MCDSTVAPYYQNPTLSKNRTEKCIKIVYWEWNWYHRAIYFERKTYSSSLLRAHRQLIKSIKSQIALPYEWIIMIKMSWSADSFCIGTILIAFRSYRIWIVPHTERHKSHESIRFSTLSVDNNNNSLNISFRCRFKLKCSRMDNRCKSERNRFSPTSVAFCDPKPNWNTQEAKVEEVPAILFVFHRGRKSA